MHRSILLRETFEKDPEAVRAFVAASMEGWREAFAQPDAAVDLMIRIMDAAHLPANRVHQRWMLDRMRDLMQPVSADDPPGRLRMADYQRVGNILLANGLIHTLPPYPSFCIQANRP